MMLRLMQSEGLDPGIFDGCKAGPVFRDTRGAVELEEAQQVLRIVEVCVLVAHSKRYVSHYGEPTRVRCLTDCCE